MVQRGAAANPRLPVSKGVSWLEGASRAIEGLLELGWLAALLGVPIYFNINDVRAFEPDKAYLLRDCAAIIAVLALLSLVLRQLRAPTRPIGSARRGRGAASTRLRLCVVAQRLPTLLPMIAQAAAVLLATLTSILPSQSWYGSYARTQGALTTLAYLIIGLAILGFLRRPAQVERLGMIIALSGVAPAAYGWVQHFGRDPLPWQQADLVARVPGTMGNPIFLGALLVMTLPLGASRLLLALWPQGKSAAHAPSWRQVPAVLGWTAILVLELGALLFTKSRGPFAGLLTELPLFALPLSLAWNLPWLRQFVVALIAAAAAILLVVNLLGSSAFGRMSETSALRLLQWNPRTSGSSEVRLDIWGPALQLIPKRPLLGCGPDVLTYCYYPVYPTALRHIEAPNAVPDRTHNMFLDAAVETGLLGLATLLALLGISLAALTRLTRSAASVGQQVFAAAALAALAGHLMEGFFGIEIVASQLLTWVLCAAAGALMAMTTAPVAPDQSRIARLSRRQAARRTIAQPLAARVVVTTLLLCALVGALVAAWQVVQVGASATAADVSAAQAADVEHAAMGNSGQAPVLVSVHPRPVLALQQFAAATALRNQAIADAPREEEYLLDAGTTYVNWAQAASAQAGVAARQAQDLYVQALVDFGKAARLNPYNPDHFRNTGKAYERWAGLGHDPSQPASWNQELLQRAADAFAHAAQLAPHHPDPLTSWAEVALWQGRPTQAVSLANRALALDPRDGDGYRLRAQAEIAMNQRPAALVDWRRALADPTIGHRGETAARFALAEATWARARCPAVSDARIALAAGGMSISDTTTMHEIIHVDGPSCHAG